MLHSIQDYLKKINSWLSLTDIISLLITASLLVTFALYLHKKSRGTTLPATYIVAEAKDEIATVSDTRPFASKHGKTYTFSWCQGSSRIKEANKVFFINETEALQSGRTLSKLCKK
jgi:hypothetical protein